MIQRLDLVSPAPQPEPERKTSEGSGVAFDLALNCCPRCPTVLATPLNAVADMHTFVMVWGLRRAAQLYFRQREVHQFLAAGETSARRNTLELIRDHIDCGIPYLYELLAFFAGSEGDETAKNAALEQLKKFGPQFANWESKWAAQHPTDGSAPWLKRTSAFIRVLASNSKRRRRCNSRACKPTSRSVSGQHSPDAQLSAHNSPTAHRQARSVLALAA